MLITKILKNPITIILSSVLGALFGFYFKDQSMNLSFVGEAYLRLLQMCVIPILVTAISLGIGELVLNHKEKIKKNWWKLLISLLVLFLVSFLGVLGGYLSEPGNITDKEQRKEIGKIISNFDQIDLSLSFDLSQEEEYLGSTKLDKLAEQIPNNIFESLLEGKAMQLVIFSIIFGIAIGLLSERKKSQTILRGLDSIFDSFKKIIDLVLSILPFGLFCLVAKQVANMGLNVFATMASFIVVFHVIGLVIMALSIAAISIFSRKNFFLCLQAMLNSIITAFSTRSSLATMPIASKALSKIGYQEKSSNLYVSLLIPLFRFGNVLFYALAGVFFLQLYNKGLDGNMFAVAFNSVIAGFASIGTTGVLTLQPLSYVLSPLNLPTETAIILLMSIDPIIDPLRTTLIVQLNTMLAAFLAERE